MVTQWYFDIHHSIDYHGVCVYIAWYSKELKEYSGITMVQVYKPPYLHRTNPQKKKNHGIIGNINSVVQVKIDFSC